MDIQAYIQSGIIETYVLGFASDEESAELLRLAAQHSEIKAALEAFEIAIEKTASNNTIPPPQELKNKIMLSLKAEEEKNDLPGIAPIISLNEKIETNNIISIWKYAAVAAIFLLVASTGLNFYFYGNLKNINNDYQALLNERNLLQANNNNFQTRLNNYEESLEILQNPAMVVVRMEGTPDKIGNLATVYWNNESKDVYLMPNSLEKTPEDKQYQLWALVDGVPVDAGVIGDCEGICKMKNIPRAQAFAITLENKGGSPTPTLTQMFVIGNV